jgi:hypothetical protein
VDRIELNKSQFYDKLVEYYYDNIHWTEPECPSIYEWAKRDYGADISRFGHYIAFDEPEDATFFTMLWT